MKALILAGGRGKRLEGISDSRNKCMLRLLGKPLIEYSLDTAAKSEANEIVIVVGYRAEDIINAYGVNYEGKRVKYVIQREQRGLVNAIECSREALENDDIMLLLGDEILVNPRNNAMVELFKGENLFGVCGIVIEDNLDKISKTYTLVQDGQRRIYRLIEKPKKALNNMMGTGNCVFKNEILSYIERTPINQERGEKELPDLIQCAIDEGNVVKSFKVCDRYFNINSEEDLQETERHIKARKGGIAQP
jgi:NDP-sugar pyrophosphorylase family protein